MRLLIHSSFLPAVRAGTRRRAANGRERTKGADAVNSSRSHATRGNAYSRLSWVQTPAFLIPTRVAMYGAPAP
uniref:Uncharacterized protein n=1 Tax=Candidatus Kentrum sp. MB TaxID=2138164 RepID=A0A450WZY0_9GAMM|nr:MAG: hypothetical protein BECKMB1821G_GA0114241_100274 [Candidatus Kentron sp. MB]VFK28901.1 MAG: hypothetical protein BECKMB1821I_GA0114274_100780 [Candidatus Kentron sp. MB]